MKVAKKKPRRGQATAKSKRRGSRLVRFREAEGKTVEFVEMCTSAEFPCVEIGFADKTALHFLIEPGLTIEPEYSRWKTGNRRVLRSWPPVACR